MLERLISRPIAVTMVLMVVVILGAVGGRMLPVGLVPDVDAPFVTVQVSSEGMAARELDETVVRPLRQELIQISGLVDMRSQTREGVGVIKLTFEQGIDIDYAFIEVNEKIDRSMSLLPKDTERPKAVKASATDIPSFYINMSLKDDSGDAVVGDELYPVSERFSDLSDFARNVIVGRIEQLEEVAMVDISGTVEREILVLPDEALMRQAGLALGDIETVLVNADVELGNLTIRDGEYQYNVRFRSNSATIDDIKGLYFNVGGRLFRLGDIAEVIEHPRKRQGMVSSDGKSAVTMALIKQSDARMADLRESLDELMSHFAVDYPEIEFTVTRDQTELLDYSISNLESNIAIGAILACVVIFMFMQDWKSPLLVSFTIPVALVLSLLVFYCMGITINIISLSGLVLGIGMMVDNSIIVTDNITARWQRGEKLSCAVVNGTKEVLTPMLSSILTTCAVFIPLIFISGIAGAMFYDQAMAVTITLFSAYLVTITVIPVYYNWFYRKQNGFKPSKALQKFDFGRVISFYDRGLEWLFAHRWVVWGSLALSVVGIVSMFMVIDKEKLPAMTYSDMLVKIEWNSRISAEENGRRSELMVAQAGEAVEQSTVMAGVQQFVLSHTEQSSVSEATVYIKCRTAADVERVQSLVSDYMERNYPEASYSFAASGNIFDMIFADHDATLTARLRSTEGEISDPGRLREVVAEIGRNLPNVNIPRVQVQENILYVARPEVMALYGVTYSDLVSVLRNALNENRIYTVTSGSESMPVVLGSDTKEMSRIMNGTFIRTRPVGGTDGETGDNKDKENTVAEIPVGTFMMQTTDADLKTIVSGAEGNFYPLDMEIDADMVPQVIETVRGVIEKTPDFEVSFSGSYFSNREMISQLVMVLTVSLLLLYFIISAQFESLVQPLIIMSEIVIDLFGALLVLWLFGQTLNLMSMIGLVVVCGIVINDSILKVDTINGLRKEGMELKRAIVEAGGRRLKAIVMTSLTTILAMLPSLSRGNMGADLQYPMSLVIIGGMIIGTAVSVYFVPIVYYEIYKPRKR